jgi:hypothetical protein
MQRKFMSREIDPSRTAEVTDTPTVETHEVSQFTPQTPLRDALPGLVFGILMIILAIVGVAALAMATARASG